MKVKNLAIISIVAVMFLLSGCELYDYSKLEGGEIPVTVAKEIEAEPVNDAQDVDEFKKQLEKLQSIIDAEEKTEEMIEEVSEGLEVEETNETEEVEETVEEEVEENETEEVEESSGDKPTLTVKEGDLVDLGASLTVTDPDGDKLTYTFTKPLDDKGKWQTGYDDAGKYTVKVTASDGKLNSEQEIVIIVEETNRAPIISGLEDLEVDEGDTVKLNPKATDPDGGTVTITYSGWMNKNTKEVGYDQAGMHTVTVKAIDSDEEESKKTITITVNDVNRAPVIQLK